MDNLRSVLNIVLSKIPAVEILNDMIRYDNITEENFVKLAGYYVKNYSNDELKNLFDYIQSEYSEQTDYLKGYSKEKLSGERFDVFNIILLFAVKVLTEQNGIPVCRYEHLLRWRMTSHQLDEDVFTTAYLAYRDRYMYNGQRDFSWRSVISHNNVYLKNILSKGMAENHFHLKGSAPQFPLSWLYMMNHVTKPNVRKALEQYGNKRLSVIYYTGDEEEHIYISYLKAALIRCFLYAKLTGKQLILKDVYDKMEKDEVWKYTEDIVFRLLRGKDEILEYRNQIQENIAHYYCVEEKYPVTQLDYIGAAGYYKNPQKADTDGILSGERWFLYQMFGLIFSRDQRFKDYYNMFYAYLVIKETIRSELVQTNYNIGYDNFERYQNRKEDFIEGTIYEKYYIRMAVKGTLLNQHIRFLETRISPKKSAEEDKKAIQKYDNMIDSLELQQRYFYVFHFIKEKENKEVGRNNIQCRHYAKRIALRQQALGIAKLREKYPKQAARIRGIDACASEIGCRPEVFAHTYRYLSNHMVYYYDYVEQNIPQLNMTYHIGEDYLDIADGLRAIDEAIRYLKLNCGSRVGHALVLGVNVDEYYDMKNRRILISEQDYLDNLVWIYYKIKKYELQGYEDLKIFIEQEYEKYFQIIYKNNITDNDIGLMLQDASRYFQKKKGRVAVEYSNSSFHFGMPEYYAAYKLRGDDPECYINGFYQEKDEDHEWNRYSVDRDSLSDFKIRYNPESAYIYYLYHYNALVKNEGAKVIEVYIHTQYISCVKEIQYKMRYDIAKKGIGIEANPSSNYMIGTFKRYDKHPIIKFYDKDLTKNIEEEDRCPQIPVCINTDDQGIFSTYLDNEYALLALALEKVKDSNGRQKYNRLDIYQWIDNLRENGMNLSFMSELGR